MKKIIFVISLIVLATLQNGFAQDTSKVQTSLLLISYYSLKDALVAGNAKAAATSAEGFVKALNNTDKETVKDKLRVALLTDASAISQNQKLSSQREKFATLSDKMF